MTKNTLQKKCTDKNEPVTPAGLTSARIAAFQKRVLNYYRRNARDLPWRATTDPYCIMVSEIMLQQTQVDRVIPKYDNFIARFPDVESLAASALKDVLTLWQGLGYNRRAQNLHNCARIIIRDHGGHMPASRDTLMTLPGIGANTAAALCVYAYNQPCVFIETNIRAVYIQTFFPKADAVSDKQLVPCIEATLYKRNPRRWYNALMDYGVYLKKLHGNPARKSRHRTVQSRFEGSARQIRGMAIKILGQVNTISMRELKGRIDREPERVRAIVEQLIRERLVKRQRTRLSLP